MTDIERKLLVKVLELAADKFGNHICNDFDLIGQGGLTPDEASLLQTRLLSDGIIDEPCNSRYTADWILMLWLAKRVEKMP